MIADPLERGSKRQREEAGHWGSRRKEEPHLALHLLGSLVWWELELSAHLGQVCKGLGAGRAGILSRCSGPWRKGQHAHLPPEASVLSSPFAFLAAREGPGKGPV